MEPVPLGGLQLFSDWLAALGLDKKQTRVIVIVEILFCATYLVTCKVYTDVCGKKQLCHGLPACTWR